MGTNYYLMTKNKLLARKHFAVERDWGVTDEEYKIVDEPHLGYEIHLNKCSAGWRPLFQKHKAFSSWKELERFYLNHADDLEIYDEYKIQYTWEEYKELIFKHANREPEPLKWVYEYQKLAGHKVLDIIRCEPEEAELWTPIDHVQYFKTEEAAKKAFRLYDCYPGVIYEVVRHEYNDPDYNIDWTEGDFS